MTIVLTLFVALVGVLMYALCTNGKLQEIGKILFWTGILAFLLRFSDVPFHIVR